MSVLTWQQPHIEDSRAPVPRLLLRPPEAADSLAMSLRGLMNLVNNNEIPVVRIGQRSLRFSVQALQDWVDARTIGKVEKSADAPQHAGAQDQ